MADKHPASAGTSPDAPLTSSAPLTAPPLAAPPPSSPSADAPSAARARSPVRWLIPLVLFVLIIGGIAWIVQNMPTWRGRTPPAAAPAAPKGPELLVRFVHPFDRERHAHVAVWEDFEKLQKPETKERPRLYAREFERGAEGRYYFPFYVTEQGCEVGVSSISCDCAELHVAAVPAAEWEPFANSIKKNPEATPVENPAWTWQPLTKSENQGVALPPGRAILRVVWVNRRAAGDNLNLATTVWARSGSQSQYFQLRIDAVSTHPLRTKRDRANVGFLGPGGVVKARFLLWSPTRDHVKFTLDDRSNDKLFKIDVQQRDPDACAELQAQLRRDDIMTVVRAAWDVTVTIHENKDGAQLDQGYFVRAIGYELQDAADEIPPLVITGVVRSDDIAVGAEEDQGKINLKFDARQGTTKRILVMTNRNIELDPQDVRVQPAAIRVKLTEKPAAGAAASAGKRKWELEVHVPPNLLFGTIAEESAVTLRTKGKSPRSIRIPLTGHAVQR
ncbi:MAG: hypothetical protein L0Y71_16445 [Gemmataceae bacterium]|nr:hypothetical protein [Gemmataceae bacterium]